MTDTDRPATTAVVTRRRKAWMAAVFAVVVAAGLVVFLVVRGSGGNAVVDGARDACREYVKARLQVPKSAVFSGENVTHHMSPDTYVVSGFVDRENAARVDVRDIYRCEVSHATNGWQLVSLSGVNE